MNTKTLNELGFQISQLISFNTYWEVETGERNNQPIVRIECHDSNLRLEYLVREQEYHVEKPLHNDGEFATLKFTDLSKAIEAFEFTNTILLDIKEQLDGIN